MLFSKLQPGVFQLAAVQRSNKHCYWISGGFTRLSNSQSSKTFEKPLPLSRSGADALGLFPLNSPRLRLLNMGKKDNHGLRKLSSSSFNLKSSSADERKEEGKKGQELAPKQSSEPVPSSDATPSPGTQTTSAKLKQAVKDYGATVIVFHVSMSLVSLGFFYLLVTSGLDISAILQKLGVDESIFQNKITQGASTFVIAYAVHKIFAPVRLGITLTATPFIVRKLRNLGILKKPTA